ncbi:unnamed protein product [Mortierella alpina]
MKEIQHYSHFHEPSIKPQRDPFYPNHCAATLDDCLQKSNDFDEFKQFRANELAAGDSQAIKPPKDTEATEDHGAHCDVTFHPHACWRHTASGECWDTDIMLSRQ